MAASRTKSRKGTSRKNQSRKSKSASQCGVPGVIAALKGMNSRPTNKFWLDALSAKDREELIAVRDAFRNGEFGGEYSQKMLYDNCCELFGLTICLQAFKNFLAKPYTAPVTGAKAV